MFEFEGGGGMVLEERKRERGIQRVEGSGLLIEQIISGSVLALKATCELQVSIKGELQGF